MSFSGPRTAVTGAVAGTVSSVSLFGTATSVSGRYVYNASTAACTIVYGTVASATVLTLVVASSAGTVLPGSYGGPVAAIWSASNGTAYTTQW